MHHSFLKINRYIWLLKAIPSLAMTASFQLVPCSIGEIQAYASRHREHVLTTCSSNAAHEIYDCIGAEGHRSVLTLSPEQLSQITTAADLKELLEKNNVLIANSCYRGVIKTWDNKEYESALETLRWRSDNPEKLGRAITLTHASNLLSDTKKILATFSAPHTHLFPNDSFIKKSEAFCRLTTYTRLEQVIKEDQLAHIHLPFKMLAIKDTQKNKYIPHEQISEIINACSKIGVMNNEKPLEVTIEHYSERYTLEIFAEKKARNSEIPLNKHAIQNLVHLLHKSPFDIGDNNIFTDINGDAVIIDTELKGDKTATAISKLARYPMTQEARAELDKRSLAILDI